MSLKLGNDLSDHRMGPTTVNSASLQVVGTIPIGVAAQGLATNGIAHIEIILFAVFESATDVYSQVWRINHSVQVISGPTYRLGTLISKSQIHSSSSTSPPIAGSTGIAMDISGSDIRLLVQASDTHGSAKCWARCSVHPSTGA
jgi:hypothetical protein